MSNTRIKGVTRVRSAKQNGWLVRAMWNGKRRQVWVPRRRGSLNKAVRIRRQLDRELGRPITERQVRASGRQGGVHWRRKVQRREGSCG